MLPPASKAFLDGFADGARMFWSLHKQCGGNPVIIQNYIAMYVALVTKNARKGCFKVKNLAWVHGRLCGLSGEIPIIDRERGKEDFTTIPILFSVKEGHEYASICL